ncbi:hypothetical protein BU24DRAFT_492614 [Aaosphaeria arxii CBS 175.79]|uniref:Uncharacterized protein n=1 Tax=Aaosphaeria arxii CBS 175.79 TaxID=1450172 RepID=A0A6A5XUE9_9PLEO|nr:uncharacterized protein BU24DRAFT_492614 [Aaosphaeria arxii CBS 175.79]KAF2016546.1 hypothetical protein BU24DRAFT_492614 [Aaosphaeria arxii CBS 175.79]
MSQPILATMSSGEFSKLLDLLEEKVDEYAVRRSEVMKRTAQIAFGSQNGSAGPVDGFRAGCPLNPYHASSSRMVEQGPSSSSTANQPNKAPVLFWNQTATGITAVRNLEPVPVYQLAPATVGMSPSSMISHISRILPKMREDHPNLSLRYIKSDIILNPADIIILNHCIACLPSSYGTSSESTVYSHVVEFGWNHLTVRLRPDGLRFYRDLTDMKWRALVTTKRMEAIETEEAYQIQMDRRFAEIMSERGKRNGEELARRKEGIYQEWDFQAGGSKAHVEALERRKSQIWNAQKMPSQDPNEAALKALEALEALRRAESSNEPKKRTRKHPIPRDVEAAAEFAAETAARLHEQIKSFKFANLDPDLTQREKSKIDEPAPVRSSLKSSCFPTPEKDKKHVRWEDEVGNCPNGLKPIFEYEVDGDSGSDGSDTDGDSGSDGNDTDGDVVMSEVPL